MIIDPAYLSCLSSDLDGGTLLAVYILAVCAAACLFAALAVYVIPDVKAWATPRWARWRSEQVRRANVPQEFPPEDAPLVLGPLLVILPLVALVVAVLLKCGVVR